MSSLRSISLILFLLAALPATAILFVRQVLLAYAQRQAENFDLLLSIIAILGFAGSALLVAFVRARYAAPVRALNFEFRRQLESGPLGEMSIAGVLTAEVAETRETATAVLDRLKELRQRESAIADYSLDLIVSLNEKLEVGAISPASYRMFGYPSEALTGIALQRLVSPDDWDRTYRHFENSRDGRSDRTLENRVRSATGAELDLEWWVEWSKSESAYFCVARDISERKAVERMKQDFLSMISHDLRTPLSSLQFSLDALSRNPDKMPPDSMRKLEIASRNVGRLMLLINQLLELDKLEAGMMSIEEKIYPVDSLFEQAASSLIGFAEKQKIGLKFEESGLFVRADGPRIVQVIVNLVSNAIKFSPEGESVTISAVDKQNKVEFRIADRGPGVPKEMQQAIFEKFRQVRRSDESEKGGTGLGLSICKNLIEAHGGTIGVEAEEGKGSTFWFRLVQATEDEVFGKSE